MSSIVQRKRECGNTLDKFIELCDKISVTDIMDYDALKASVQESFNELNVGYEDLIKDLTEEGAAEFREQLKSAEVMMSGVLCSLRKARMLSIMKAHPVVSQEDTAFIDDQQEEQSVHELPSTTTNAEKPETKLETLFLNMNLPKPELITFNGNPIDYNKFVHNFEVHIERKVSDNSLKLSYLIQHCSGDARNCIEDCVLMSPEQGFVKAKQLLYDYFGRPDIVAGSFVKTIVKGGPIKPNDVQSLVSLSKEMVKCQIILSKTGHYTELNNSANLREIVKRLPTHLRSKWVEHADKIITEGRDPSFSDLADFIKIRARVASTVYGLDLAEGPVRYQNKNHDNRSKSVVEKTATTLAISGEVKRSCPICNDKCPELSQCPKFTSVTVKDRLGILGKLKLCFNCFKPNHISRKCWLKSKCPVQECQQKHHGLLHKWTSQIDPGVNTATNCCVASEQRETYQRVSLNIVPVCIKGTQGRFIETNALIDQGSDRTFVDERLVKWLEIPSKDITYNVTSVHEQKVPYKGKEVSLRIESIDRSQAITVDKVWTMSKIPVKVENRLKKSQLASYPHLYDLDIPTISSNEVMMLIGSDVTDVTVPCEVRRGKTGEPCAQRSVLGWSIVGPIQIPSDKSANVNFQRAEDVKLQRSVELMWTTEFEQTNEKEGMSQEDRVAIKKMESSIKVDKDGHYEIGLPWRDEACILPNNKSLVIGRLESLKNKLLKDKALREMYCSAMTDYIAKGYIIPASNVLSTKTWYLPHHPVQNPNKPGKVRVVFDCAAKYNGKCLNDYLLQGPDQVNDLVGVLLRFRQDKIAMMADIEQMYYQVRVPETDREAFRLLWWPGGDLSTEPKEYCMAVHVFGATSSPSCASFALRSAARDQAEIFDAEVVETAMKSFYVDDLLKSVSSIEQSLRISKMLTEMLRNRGFKLCKWVSNCQELVSAIADSDLATNMVGLSFDDDELIDKALGVQWDVKHDQICYNIKNINKPVTRRGILSVVSSLFDPMGLVSPVLLPAKSIIQDLCKMKIGWDDPIPDEYAERWQKWLRKLSCLENIRIDRCIKGSMKGKIVATQLHIFSDASESGYGACAYACLHDDLGQKHATLILGKSRLAPIKKQTVPRLELTAAVVACKLKTYIEREMEIRFDKIYLWSDSMIVLGYINNMQKRFKTFVANRLSVIHNYSQPNQWRHVPGQINPADIASRGVNADDKERIRLWIKGPNFLTEDMPSWPPTCEKFNVKEDDCEVKREAQVCTTNASQGFSCIFERFSNWMKLVNSVAWLKRFVKFIHCKTKDKPLPKWDSIITASELEIAGRDVVSIIQREFLSTEVLRLQEGRCVDKQSVLFKLNPFIRDGIVRVGGRIANANVQFNTRHPIVVPKSHISVLLVRFYHKINGHVGKNQVLNSLKEKYWLIKGSTIAKSELAQCIVCKRFKAQPCKQIMASLPEERLTANMPPFSFTGVDFFGPLTVKVGRHTEKRYGCLFTCLVIRAVHIEITHNLNTDSFLGALDRFISRRGRPKKIMSDRGTNIVAAEKELRDGILKLDPSKGMAQRMIEWEFNPPYASHMGGAWERLIRSVKLILKMILEEQLLKDEALQTYLCLVEKILNDRPLTKVSNDVNDPTALTPNHLLLLKGNESFPIGTFSVHDSYIRRWWCQAQYMADVFWKRWTKEYLPLLQTREKWQKVTRNLKVGDLVLIVDELKSRGQWPLGLVTEVNIGRDGNIRSCRVRTSKSTLVRPITKLCLLEASD